MVATDVMRQFWYTFNVVILASQVDGYVHYARHERQPNQTSISKPYYVQCDCFDDISREI